MGISTVISLPHYAHNTLIPCYVCACRNDQRCTDTIF